MGECFEDPSPMMTNLTRLSRPLLLYGTASKENRTRYLTEVALNIGFTAVDTANHPTAYNEPHTGDAIARAIKSGVARREDLFIQTKFSPPFTAPRDKLPYNPDQSIDDQVHESFHQSLKHLQVDYLDSYVLHAPYEDDADSIAAYKAFEKHVQSGLVKQLGVSNVNLEQLQAIYRAASIKPKVVQNRFFRGTSYDLQVRAFCADHDITYQAFWMLSHNPELLDSDVMTRTAEKLGTVKEVAFYVLILSLGDVQILDGTTRPERMKADLSEIAVVFRDEKLLEELQPFVADFKRLLWEIAGSN